MNMNERKIEINTQGGALITGGVFIGTQFVVNNPVKNERIETFSLNEKNSQDEELKFKNEESHPDKDEADILIAGLLRSTPANMRPGIRDEAYQEAISRHALKNGRDRGYYRRLTREEGRKE